MARCCDGIMPFRYARRTGSAAASVRLQSTISTTTTQKLATSPISDQQHHTDRGEQRSAPRCGGGTACRMNGVSSPPTICAPATIAATSPATPYACGSPHSSSR